MPASGVRNSGLVMDTNPDGVVHRKAPVARGEQSRGQALRHSPRGDKQLEHLGAKAEFEQLGRNQYDLYIVARIF